MSKSPEQLLFEAIASAITKKYFLSFPKLQTESQIYWDLRESEDVDTALRDFTDSMRLSEQQLREKLNSSKTEISRLQYHSASGLPDSSETSLRRAYLLGEVRAYEIVLSMLYEPVEQEGVT